MTKQNVLQFKISLRDIIPTIWRRIQVLDTATFWDLHVAIQNAMGWKDCHLHQFFVRNPQTNHKELIGIPDHDEDQSSILAGWELPITDYLAYHPNKRMSYVYDFSDYWEHLIEYEGTYPKQDAVKYPRCLEGKRACPPEDVGGPLGYQDYVHIISKPHHEKYLELLDWRGPFEADDFDPKKVQFSSPLQHLKIVIEHQAQIQREILGS